VVNNLAKDAAEPSRQGWQMGCRTSRSLTPCRNIIETRFGVSQNGKKDTQVWIWGL